jgi:hypothetical protein
MHRLAVGRPHHGLTPPLADGCHFNWSDAGAELLITLHAPTASEVESAATRACEFALAVVEPAVWLLSTFHPGLPWSDAPYCVHLLEPERRPDTAVPTPESRLVLQVVLVDGRTAVVRARRAVSLSPAFTRALARAVEDQLAAPWDGRSDYDRRLALVYQRHPSAEALLAAATHRTAGGA